MHTPGGVANIRLVSENVLFLPWSTRIVSRCMIWEDFHSPLVSCSECLHRRWRNYVLFTVLATVTPLLYSHRFDSIQILNALVRVLCLPPPFGLFLFFIDVFNNVLWHCLGELGYLSLRSLVSRLESTVTASRAPGTTEAYRRAFLRWKEFASSKMEICAFLANSEHVALYL